MSPTISAVIIAKNEERVIERCIRSVLEFDEIIVYDTGSADRTVELAKAFGGNVKVHQRAEPIVPFHFAQARNEANALASSDWLMTIDCDEVLDKRATRIIRKRLARKQDVVAYEINYAMRALDEAPSRYFTIRIIRRGRWQWRGRVHNELMCIITPTPVGRIKGAFLEHQPDPDKRESRREQSLELLELAVQEEPHRPRLRRHLALELLLRGEPKLAIPHIKIYNEKTEDSELDKSEGFCIQGRAEDRAGDLEAALGSFETAAKISPKRREPYYLGGRALMIRGKYKDAADWIKRAVSIPISSKPVYHLNWESVWTEMPSEALSWCLGKVAEGAA